MTIILKRIFVSHYSAVAVLLAVGIIASFLREITLAYYYGTSKEVEIFRLSILLPHMLTQNCAPAFLATCLPLLNKYPSSDGAGHAEQTVFTVNILFSFGFLIAGILSADILARILAPGFDGPSQAALISSLKYAWFYFFFASLSLTTRTRLLRKEIYWPGSISSAVIGFVFIVVIIFFQSFPIPLLDKKNLPIAMICSGFAVFLVHVCASGKYNLNKINLFHIKLNDKLIGILIYAMFGAILFKLLNFVPRLLDRVVATTMEQGVLACLEYSYGILNIFGILIGTTVSTVVAPRFLKQYAVKGIVQTFLEIKHILILVVLGSVVISVVGFVFSEALVSVVFKRGNFGEHDVEVTSSIFRWLIFALPLVNLTLILSQLFIIIEKVKLLLLSVAVKLASKALTIFFLIKYFEESIFGITLFISELTFLLTLLWMLTKISRIASHEMVK